MNITVVDDQGKEPQELEIKNPETTPVITGGLLEQSVGQMFNLRPEEISNMSDKIGLLIQYAKTMVDDPSEMNIKWAIRSLGSKVGTPPLGEKLINYLTQYAYLHLEGLKIAEEKEKFIKNNI